jgi:hypothetical protein
MSREIEKHHPELVAGDYSENPPNYTFLQNEKEIIAHPQLNSL